MFMDVFNIIVLALFVNNVVLVQLLGISPLNSSSEKLSSVLSMGVLLLIVMLLSNLLTALLYVYILQPLGLNYLKIISFMLLIFVVVQMLNTILNRVKLSFFKSVLNSFPSIGVNTLVIGVALLASEKQYDVWFNVLYAVVSAVGYTLVSVLWAGIKEQLRFVALPKAMQGTPILLITLGLLAMAFMGFTGMLR